MPFRPRVSRYARGVAVWKHAERFTTQFENRYAR